MVETICLHVDDKVERCSVTPKPKTTKGIDKLTQRLKQDTNERKETKGYTSFGNSLHNVLGPFMFRNQLLLNSTPNLL